MDSRLTTGSPRAAWSGVALAVFLVGCGGNVVVDSGRGGGGGDGGDGGAPWTGSTSGPTGTAGAGGGASTAIALTYAQLKAAGGGTGGFGGGPSPDTQFLMYGTGSEAPSCGTPYGPGGCGGWSVTIRVPPEAFKVGLWLPGADGIELSMFESFGAGGNTCSAGGGGGFDEGAGDPRDHGHDGALPGERARRRLQLRSGGHLRRAAVPVAPRQIRSA